MKRQNDFTNEEEQEIEAETSVEEHLDRLWKIEAAAKEYRLAQNANPSLLAQESEAVAEKRQVLDQLLGLE